MSTSSAQSSSHHNPMPNLTIQELDDLMHNETLRPSMLDSAFPLGYHSTMTLRYFTFVSYSIKALSAELEKQHQEREQLFDQLTNSR
jgi:hypothetical protein